MSTRRHDPNRTPLSIDERHDWIIAAMGAATAAGTLQPERRWLLAWSMLADSYVAQNRFLEAATAREMVRALLAWRRTGRFPAADLQHAIGALLAEEMLLS